LTITVKACTDPIFLKETVPNLLRITFALGIGTAGGCLFFLLHLPLPWMLGALFATMTAAVAGAPVTAPNRMRPAVVAIIGVLLGSQFTPDVVDQALVWLGTIAVLMAYVVVVALTVVPFYRYVGKLDWVTSYFAGMPGGLSEMIEVGEANGAQPVPIILAHSLRIVATIAMIAFWFRYVQGFAVGASVAGPHATLSGFDAILLLACAILGSLIASRLNLTAPTFLGPLILSALVHLTGITQSTPPPLLIVAAQVVLGTVLGCRFQGIRPATLFHAGMLSVAATILTLSLALGTGMIMQATSGVSVEQAVLALAPGGLTEMGLIAMAIHSDVAFVALHHVVRIIFVLVVAPFAFKRLAGTLFRPVKRP